MKKFLSLILSLTMIMCILPSSIYAADKAVIMADSVTGNAGETVDVIISCKSNPGIVSANFNVSFDEGLILVGAIKGNVFPAYISYIPPRQLSTVGEITNSCNFAWSGTAIENADIIDGTIITLKFRISDSSKIGDVYNVNVSARNNDIIDNDMLPVAICFVEGHITVNGIPECNHIASESVHENENAATCTAAGSYDEVVYCSVCKAEMSRTQKTIAKLAHTETTINAVTATCSQPGYTGDIVCSVCNTVITKGTVIESGSGHEYGEWVNDKEATCGETGSKHRVCSACGNIETVNIPVTAHSYSTVFVPATCTDYAKDVKTCIKCGDTTESKAVARGYVYHRYVSVSGGQIYTYPTKPITVSTIYETVTLSSQLSVVGTSTSGVKIYGNYNYGQGGNRWYLKEEINRNVNPTGHKFSEYIPDNNATCITDGTKTAVCSACGVRDTVVIENSKTAHEFNAGVVTPPTATEKGYTTYTCQREGCGYSYTDNFVWPTDEAGTKLTIETTKAKTGDEISVKLMLNNNTGIAGFALSLDYDESVLELKEAINGNLFSGFTQGKNYLWDESGDVTESGLLATLVFKVSESAQPGDYIVGATVRGCTNSKLEDVALTVDPGKITITDFEYGDANDDGVIDMKDVVLIRKYIANYDFDTETSDVETGKGADTNGDSMIDMKDVVLLRMYIANYDYDTNSSTVVLGPQ